MGILGTTPASVLVVGASLAGLSAVRALRERGYTGQLTIVGSERSAPYDRPPLSKEFLTGALTEDDISLMSGDDAALDTEWLMDRTATGLSQKETGGYRVTFSDGTLIEADAVILATGARARTLPGCSEMGGVHTLRGLEDARALRDSLSTSRNLVVVGAGFIGAEVASSAASMGLNVTVVEASPTPLAGPLGNELGAVCADQHTAHGVELLTGAAVAKVVGDDHVRAVQLADGRVLPADTVLVGIGAVPNVEWAASSGILIDDGFVTDSCGQTSLPGVYAIGDCARAYDLWVQAYHRSEHWSNAIAQAGIAADSIMGRTPGSAVIPYFWSRQYGKMLQFAGIRQHTDQVRWIEGDPVSGTFVVVYEREGVPVGVFAMNNVRLFTRYKKQLSKTHSPQASRLAVSAV
ncbi:NAD(P)/FAD-dependent oxidoreductase [Hoyosella subflava]|uniref:Putative ferredoxin--NAD(+) reductase n=1 Tax=Hoyosella subflava (strain DSM 45089 / JCM 17490 / NBRC 109087 / DQS3-9A1) TaxID=443218 RepID=F6EPM6_HOYSD|nr:FAD-dependent oxidoreductase [Hoyosella subflava]AEF39459.1 putative ferredoxin--NAD(+) reductase [Hoyosella subflava DQS3-9A1]